jgi:hypothetical protein
MLLTGLGQHACASRRSTVIVCVADRVVPAKPRCPMAACEPIDERVLAIPATRELAQSFRARVEHLIVPQDGQLLPILTQLLGCSQVRVGVR